ncbi:MAG: Gfo/Idh/MocA family oxidoreductase, partial [Planctomycetota bacterium]
MGDSERQEAVTGASSVSRRSFLSGAAAAAFSVVPAHVLAGGGQSPSDRLNIAGVGLGAVGCEDLDRCSTENIVALCDVDWDYAGHAFERWPDAERYRDYQRMLDREDDLDAVVVATPDHTHAVITAAAMERGLHVYTEMPLAHNPHEVRRLQEIARETGVVTQMGNRRHSGPNVRRTCELVWNGVLGPVRRAECWTNRPTWPQGMSGPEERRPAPESLDWNLWLGPARKRPYSPAYHPGGWKGWQDFGTGALGAMGCHVMDAAFWPLKLGDAPSFTVEADSTGINEQTYPRASTVRYRFPARGDMPPVTLTWHDGGRKPEPPEGWPESREDVGSNGTFLFGEDRTIVVGQTIG